MLKIQI